jgi:hypothetical protein
MKYANSCNNEKSQLALVKTFSETPKRVLVFLETNLNWKERISKNMLDGKLYYEKAK